MRLRPLSVFAALAIDLAQAQLTTGRVYGYVDRSQRPTTVYITGPNGFVTTARTDAAGRFSIVLPYGRFRFRLDAATQGVVVAVPPLGTISLTLPKSDSEVSDTSRRPGVWTDLMPPETYAEGFQLQSVLLSREPSTVTELLDFTGLSDNRLSLFSQRGFSWTDTRFTLNGLDATDAWQPGRPVLLPDVLALSDVSVKTGLGLNASNAFGSQVGVFLRESDARWHAALSTSDTGSSLGSSNLPSEPNRGSVQQSDLFRWMTRDSVEIGGPLTRRADVFASATGQWVSQTMPLLPPGSTQGSRLLYANARTRVRASAHDELELIYSGTRLDLSNGGTPAGIEAFAARRMSPEFFLPYGFANERENDHLDFVQVGWTHTWPGEQRFGVLDLRYGFSTAHLNTSPSSMGVPDQSRIELVDGAIAGSPPIGNLAARPRNQIAGAWQPESLGANKSRHQVTIEAAWSLAAPRNRFTAPSNLNLVTAGGAPAFVVVFNTPGVSRESIRDFTASVAGHMTLAKGFSLDGAALLDASHGIGITWNTLSPRIAFGWQMPYVRGIVLRGGYMRLYAPLAGRYLDFGNPNSLSGSEYQWIDRNHDGWFEAGDQGALLMRFGGLYSSISPSLQRPYADEFDVSAEFAFRCVLSANVQLFRRDEKNRLAAINTGVPPSAFTPVSMLDPGPDGIFGTFDDQRFTVYQQAPATFGQDRYLLTNPPGLRELNDGVVSQIATRWSRITLVASFEVEKALGPTNPGNAVFENDPGVIGALFVDPNTNIHATGRNFMNRGFVGKLSAFYRAPSSWGGLELSSVADYFDGLVFARELLVTGLAQGPFLVPATVRGSPEGGNRAQYALNWNLRAGRRFEVHMGRLSASVDVMNVTNAAQRLQESSITGPSFNLRLPTMIGPARFVRMNLGYEF